MKKVQTIIMQLRETGSSNMKQEILKLNKENDLLKNILEYTYNPFKKYGISEKIMDSLMEEVTPDLYNRNDVFEFLDYVAASNSNDIIKKEICSLVKYDSYGDILKGIILKDLKIGISSTTINKVWPKLIPKFEVQLAKKHSDVKLNDEEFIYITEKYDGIRCIAIKENNDVRFYTRQGKEILGLNKIKSDIMSIDSTDFVLDGELLATNEENLDSGDLYRKTTKIVNSKSENKENVNFLCFDTLSIKEFKHGKSKDRYAVRRGKAESLIIEKESIKLAPLLFSGTDHSVIPGLLKEIEDKGKEGLMINRDEVYECKRTKSLLKVKTMNTCDLEITGYKEGTGRNKGKLGAFIVDYKGNSVDVGSGFSDDERMSLWNVKDEMIGRVAEIQYFEETTSQQGGISLRFPVWKELREIGKEVSYN